MVLKPSKFLILLNYRHTAILFVLLGVGEERRNDPWANKTVTIKGTQGINYTVCIGHSARPFDLNNSHHFRVSD